VLRDGEMAPHCAYVQAGGPVHSRPHQERLAARLRQPLDRLRVKLLGQLFNISYSLTMNS